MFVFAVCTVAGVCTHLSVCRLVFLLIFVVSLSPSNLPTSNEQEIKL